MKKLSFNLKHFLVLCLVSALLGAIAGFATLGFVKILGLIHMVLWEKIPEQLFGGLSTTYIIALTLVGGVLVGLCAKYFGDYPKSMEYALDKFKTTKKFDYKHLPQSMLASFASLGFGGSLGPEAALISLIGGLGSWIGDALKRLTNAQEIMFVSLSSTIGTIFGSPLGGAALASQVESKKQQSKFWLFAPALIAGSISFWIFEHFSSGGFFQFDFLPYSFELNDLWTATLVALLGALLGVSYLRAETYMEKFAKHRFKNVVVRAIIGGLVLGMLGGITSYALFSGHEGIQEIMDNASTFTGLGLIAIALIKVIATSWLLATGWRGGKFFPLMFAGAAFGLGLSLLVPVIDPMVGLAAGMASALAAALQKPPAALLLLAFFFPANMYGLIAIGALLGGFTGSVLLKNKA